MRGLYVNCDDNKIPASAELSKKYSKTVIFPKKIGKGQVTYCPLEWPSEPIVEIENSIFVVYGWFIYQNERNNLAGLVQDILRQGVEVVNQVEAGVFLIYWWTPESQSVIVDPMGLSTHYIDLLDDQLKVAPSVKVLQKDNVHSINKTLSNILVKKQHLFGDYTLYDGIERLSPGCFYKGKVKHRYFSLEKQLAIPLEDVGAEINVLASHWEMENKLLPISSGLDSRFILANTKFENGFTYGPEGSPEINIASKFQNEFVNYYAYDFGAPALYKDEKQVNEEMSFGVLKPIDRLLANYLHVKETFKNANVFFDGYCGDVFQRGTFINFKGVEGELYKIFPWVYKLQGWNAKKIMQKRHSALSDDEFDLLYCDFKEKTKGLALDDRQKVTYYEFLFGRGGRYAVFGSNILSAQVFTVVSPFASKKIFNTVIHQDFYESVTYITMRKLWKNISRKFTSVKVESGYSPRTSVYFIPFIQIIYRIMFHLMPSRANYGVQMRREQKRLAKKLK